MKRTITFILTLVILLWSFAINIVFGTIIGVLYIMLFDNY